MSRTLRIRPIGAAIAVTIGALTLAGCGAGQVTQTSRQVSAVDGASVGQGAQVVIRGAQIEFPERVEGANVYPRGGAAPLTMSIVNGGAEADRLLSATSPVSPLVQISGDQEIPGGQVLKIEGQPAAAPAPVPGAPPAPGAAPAPGAPPAAGAAPAAGASARPSAAPAPTTTAAAPGSERTVSIVLTGLKEDIRAGLTYNVVLRFERAGEITVPLPVANPAEPRSSERR